MDGWIEGEGQRARQGEEEDRLVVCLRVKHTTAQDPQHPTENQRGREQLKNTQTLLRREIKAGSAMGCKCMSYF